MFLKRFCSHKSRGRCDRVSVAVAVSVAVSVSGSVSVLVPLMYLCNSVIRPSPKGRSLQECPSVVCLLLLCVVVIV